MEMVFAVQTIEIIRGPFHFHLGTRITIITAIYHLYVILVLPSSPVSVRRGAERSHNTNTRTTGRSPPCVYDNISARVHNYIPMKVFGAYLLTQEE